MWGYRGRGRLACEQFGELAEGALPGSQGLLVHTGGQGALSELYNRTLADAVLGYRGARLEFKAQANQGV